MNISFLLDHNLGSQ